MKKLNDDVVGITDAEGNMIASYSYDEWGKLLSIETAEENNAEQLAVAEMNPFRYRGYYYDNETGMYYLQSRYYNPDLCRFISADDFDYINNNQIMNLNAYAYCVNNPVNYSDPLGNSPISDRFVNVLIKIVNKFDCLVDKTKQKFEDFKLKIQGIKDNFNALIEKARTEFLQHNFVEALRNFSIKNILRCIFYNQKDYVENMPRLYKNKNEEPNHQAKDLVDIILALMIFDQISKDMIDLFGKDFTNNFFGFLENFFLMVPSSVKFILTVVKSIPNEVWKIINGEVKDNISISSIIYKFVIAYFNAILANASDASFSQLLATWGIGALPAELAVLIPGIILDKSLTPTQKFTLIFVDCVSIIVSNTISLAVSHFQVTGVLKAIATVVSILIPIATDMITKIIMKKDK